MSLTATCSTIFLASGTGQVITLPGPRERARRVPALPPDQRQAATSPSAESLVWPVRPNCPVPPAARDQPAVRKKGTDDATQVHAGCAGRRDTRRRGGRRRPGDPVR